MFSQQREEREVYGGVSAVRVLHQGFRILVIARMQTPMGQTVRKTLANPGVQYLGRLGEVRLRCEFRRHTTHRSRRHGFLCTKRAARQSSAFTESPDLQRSNIFRPYHSSFFPFSRRGFRSRPHRFDRVCSHSRCIRVRCLYGIVD